MQNNDVMKLSESDFITHILTEICDYAALNGYGVTDTVKAMGENLVALTEIATFDGWEVKGGVDNGKID